MPKIRRVQSPSIDCSRSRPYPSDSKSVELHRPMNLLESAEVVKEWKEARCPICMEPPHNAVLLKCSSYEIGCRPYMCNTSHRHSNCLDQFCKSYGSRLSSSMLQEIPLTSSTSRWDCDVQLEFGHTVQRGNHLHPNLVCPLCRGEIYGYMVLEPARRYMNSKPRSCSSETCEFQGTYSELRKHARSEHPSVRPSEIDPTRWHDWIRMEQERDLEDFLSSTQLSFGAEDSTDNLDMMSTFLFGIFSAIEELNRMSDLFNDSRLRMPVHDRRSRMTYRVVGGAQTNRSARWRTNLSSVHELDTNHTGTGRTSLSSLREPGVNRTARWRSNLSPSRMPRDNNQYYGERSPGPEISSMRMPRAISRSSHAGSRRNIHSSGRNSSGQRLRWRDHRWSMHNDQL